MNIKDLFVEVTNFLGQIRWDNIVSLVSGALISAFLGYKFMVRRENNKLRKNLEIKAAEQILEEIRKVNDKASVLLISDGSAFQSYNSSLEYIAKSAYPESDLPSVRKTIDDLSSNQLQQAKDRIYKCMNDFFGCWMDYSFAFCKFINCFETKAVILNKFIGINELLGEELLEIMDIEDKIMHLYHFDIYSIVVNSGPVDIELITQMQKLDAELQEKKAHIISIFHDLKNGLQNEFLGELFDFYIPEREPKDKEKYPVYKAGYKHTYKKLQHVDKTTTSS